MSKPFVTIYTKENSRQEFTEEEWTMNDHPGAMTFDRVDGPAVEWRSGNKHWCMDGKFHRLDGPAVVTNDRPLILHLHDTLGLGLANWGVHWYIEGEGYSEEEHTKLIQEVEVMPLVLRLIDPRKWVREFK